jgi:CBS domain-containing protein
MRVSDLCLCDVIACTRDTSLARAGALMRKYAVGTLPVVDRDDRVIGMITDRDVALEVTRRNMTPSEIFVGEVMAKPVAMCGPDDDIRDAMDLMRRHCVRRLPVVDEDERLEGILSIDDIVCEAVADRDIPTRQVMATLAEIAHEYCDTPSQARSERGTRAARRG